MGWKRWFGGMVVCAIIAGVAMLSTAARAKTPHLGAGAYGPCDAASVAANARWDWLLIPFGNVADTPQGMQQFNRFLTLNPHQKYLVRLWPIDNVGLPVYGGQATFLDYLFNPAARQYIRATIRRQIKMVQDQLAKPQNVVGYTFLEETPAHWGLGGELRAGHFTKLPAAVVHYRQAIAKAYGHPLKCDERFWLWLGKEYVSSLRSIYRLIHKEAPGKLILYWQHTNYLTLDDASFDGFPGTQPMLYPYRWTAIIKKPLCDGLMAYAGIPWKTWQHRYMAPVRKHDWFFFSQLSHPGSMRLASWATALKEAKDPLPQNLGYFFYCGDDLTDASPWADPEMAKLAVGSAGRFVNWTADPRYGKVVRISQPSDKVVSDVFQGDVPVKGGQTYHYSFLARTQHVNGLQGACLVTVWDGAKGNVLGWDPAVYVTGNTPWKRYQGKAVAPALATGARFYLQLRYASGTVWFADAALCDSAGKNLLTNGAFTQGRETPLQITGWYVEDDSAIARQWRAFCNQEHIGDAVVKRAAAHPAPVAALSPQAKPHSDAANLAANGTFKNGIDGWKFLETAGGAQTQHPKLLSRVEVPATDGGGWALQVSVEHMRWKQVLSHGTGALCLFKGAAAPNATLVVSFEARTLSGSPYLLLTRPSGGASVDHVVTMGKTWKKYTATVTTGPYVTTALFFTLVKNAANAVPIQPVVAGQFLLRNVRIVPAQPYDHS